MDVLVTAPTNIAITKYWGKSDELNIHPMNSSISITLNQKQLLTTTRITTGPGLTRCSFILNGKPQNKLPGRMKDVIIAAQLRARLMRPGPIHRYVCIESANNFPTAAGLASSASGIAALAFGLAKLYGLSDDLPGLARRGSGSASRSLAGGFVRWCATGSNPLIPSNSSVIELYPASYWPTLRVLICVTNEGSKSLGSTQAMEQTVSTSLLYQFGRIRSARINEERLLDALCKRDFPTLAEVAMRESDQLHAVCLDTWPPCLFLNAHLLISLPRYEGGILQVISTQVGDGPQLIRSSYFVDQNEEPS
ncbi:Mevalonate pyrophosphate decarboxylase [Paragonimus heterotremus]|uniref:Diphosphomevalonate decarboxylase n=1 Tax=Paragonimus heterotremus TaxID=100268 RepID=A0A8J4WDP2_9TREM|nr:Mevalonate pyrophosphate decarboxylase [Paragonimus heterotremus]